MFFIDLGELISKVYIDVTIFAVSFLLAALFFVWVSPPNTLF